MASIKEFDHLKIPLKDIKSATNSFGPENYIGGGGFGKVYRGELLLSEKLIMVAVKRLDSALGQGPPEFWKEIMMLSRYKHENLVSLLGFCDEFGENILVYEYLSNKSLDMYLSSKDLTWRQRLDICIGAARGLQYLHDPDGTQQRVLHRDIKSANILLDENWKAKVSDFGLSKFGPANQQFTFLVSNTVGTFGYCDPLYIETGYLTKESDVYSFGVVLFEVLCGRFCIENHDDFRRFLPTLAQKSYREMKLDTIIFNCLRGQISPNCLYTFSTVAHRCLQRACKERPLISEIVKELETALEYQVEYEYEMEQKLKNSLVDEFDTEEFWKTKLPPDSEDIMKKLNPIAVYTNKKDLFSLLHKGVFFDNREMVFQLNEDGIKCELISAKKILVRNSRSYIWQSGRKFRFSKAAVFPYSERLNIHCRISTSMLSSGIMYAASLVFSYQKGREDALVESSKLVRLNWKCEKLNVSSTHIAERSRYGWLKIRLWHFIHGHTNADFYIVLDKISYFKEDKDISSILLHHIEFEPVPMTKRRIGIQGIGVSISDEDVDWEKNVPSDYQGIFNRSSMTVKQTTKKELYFLLCIGILIDDGRKWFSLCKSTGGKCHMLPATEIVCSNERAHRFSVSGSRFKEVIQLQQGTYAFKCKLESDMFSPRNFYACYRVFKFLDSHKSLDERVLFFRVSYNLDIEPVGYKIAHLSFPEPINIPLIKPKNYKTSSESANIPKTKFPRMPKTCTDDSMHSWMQERDDGWMEVILCKPLHKLEDHKLLDVFLRSAGSTLDGVIVQGIEFRPMQRDI